MVGQRSAGEAKWREEAMRRASSHWCCARSLCVCIGVCMCVCVRVESLSLCYMTSK